MSGKIKNIGKAMMLICFVSCLSFGLQACEPVVNGFAFHPDTENVIPANQLPGGVQEIFIETGDQFLIQSYYIPSKRSGKLMIYFHGNAGNIGHRLPDLVTLNRLGLNVLGVSYRGYGKSQGKPSENGIYMDGDAAFAHAIGALGFQIENIFILGRSIGTTVAIHVAQKKNIAGLVLVTPLTSGADQAKASGLGLMSFLAGDAFNNIAKLSDVTCPVLVIHGSRDEMIPMSMGKTIYNQLRTEKQFVEIKGANHNNLSTRFAGAYWQPIDDFLHAKR
jgi:fermentation-respiration switch protein FrsA (DUF1100 family)